MISGRSNAAGTGCLTTMLLRKISTASPPPELVGRAKEILRIIGVRCGKMGSIHKSFDTESSRLAASVLLAIEEYNGLREKAREATFKGSQDDIAVKGGVKPQDFRKFVDKLRNFRIMSLGNGAKINVAESLHSLPGTNRIGALKSGSISELRGVGRMAKLSSRASMGSTGSKLFTVNSSSSSTLASRPAATTPSSAASSKAALSASKGLGHSLNANAASSLLFKSMESKIKVIAVKVEAPPDVIKKSEEAFRLFEGRVLIGGGNAAKSGCDDVMKHMSCYAGVCLYLVGDGSLDKKRLISVCTTEEDGGDAYRRSLFESVAKLIEEKIGLGARKHDRSVRGDEGGGGRAINHDGQDDDNDCNSDAISDDDDFTRGILKRVSSGDQSPSKKRKVEEKDSVSKPKVRFDEWDDDFIEWKEDVLGGFDSSVEFVKVRLFSYLYRSVVFIHRLYPLANAIHFRFASFVSRWGKKEKVDSILQKYSNVDDVHLMYNVFRGGPENSVDSSTH